VNAQFKLNSNDKVDKSDMANIMPIHAPIISKKDRDK